MKLSVSSAFLAVFLQASRHFFATATYLHTLAQPKGTSSARSRRNLKSNYFLETKRSATAGEPSLDGDNMGKPFRIRYVPPGGVANASEPLNHCRILNKKFVCDKDASDLLSGAATDLDEITWEMTDAYLVNNQDFNSAYWDWRHKGQLRYKKGGLWLQNTNGTVDEDGERPLKVGDPIVSTTHADRSMQIQTRQVPRTATSPPRMGVLINLAGGGASMRSSWRAPDEPRAAESSWLWFSTPQSDGSLKWVSPAEYTAGNAAMFELIPIPLKCKYWQGACPAGKMVNRNTVCGTANDVNACDVATCCEDGTTPEPNEVYTIRYVHSDSGAAAAGAGFNATDVCGSNPAYAEPRLYCRNAADAFTRGAADYQWMTKTGLYDHSPSIRFEMLDPAGGNITRKVIRNGEDTARLSILGASQACSELAEGCDDAGETIDWCFSPKGAAETGEGIYVYRCGMEGSSYWNVDKASTNAKDLSIYSSGSYENAGRFIFAKVATTTSTSTTTTRTQTTTTNPSEAEADLSSAFTEYSGKNCGLSDDPATYQPGGNATTNLVVLYSAGDTETLHIAKCVRKCASFVSDGNRGCGGFVYEKQAVTDTAAKLSGIQGSCILRQGPVDMDACVDESKATFYLRKAAQVVTRIGGDSSSDAGSSSDDGSS
ncbi:unnamed protein product [Amoebophrya sp. A25]|nr:unnamed protein product [Amoebophrya sp. A25]|eukprot:GSA25T00018046001.1